jgi:hypothetical protein
MLNDSDRPEADLPLEMHMGLESLLISLLVEAPVSMALAILSVDLIGVESAPKWWSSFLPCHLLWGCLLAGPFTYAAEVRYR